MKITNQKPNKSTLTGEGTNYELSYGIIKQNTNGDLSVQLTTEEPLKTVRTQVTCGGCTSATAIKVNENSFNININYKTSLLGNINKGVFLYPQTKEGKPLGKITIKLAGNVIK